MFAEETSGLPLSLPSEMIPAHSGSSWTAENEERKFWSLRFVEWVTSTSDFSAPWICETPHFISSESESKSTQTQNRQKPHKMKPRAGEPDTSLPSHFIFFEHCHQGVLNGFWHLQDFSQALSTPRQTPALETATSKHSYSRLFSASDRSPGICNQAAHLNWWQSKFENWYCHTLVKLSQTQSCQVCFFGGLSYILQSFSWNGFCPLCLS